MDSNTLLDYALFQLTPTRTRCDLVIYSGKKNEKLASGLLQPFVSHLKSAQDQISRGGYSIHLCPSTSQSSWFTKATLERFVKFVSTPEVLERFITIEREIKQIETSVQPKEPPMVAEAEVDESNGTVDASKGVNSRVHLHRILETRKAVLRKEQAMAYARAQVSGFDAKHLENLISFANTFGASRLREACKNFLELCAKKSNDGVWMHEVAAIALSGDGKLYNQDTAMYRSVLSSNSDSPREGKLQLPTWQNQHFQVPGFPPSYFPGYVLPGMHIPPSYFPGNVHHESDGSWKHKSSSKSKKKHLNGLKPKENDRNRSSNLSSGDDSDNYLEHEEQHSSNRRKGSSKKVVIRNINYVTSRRNREMEQRSGDSSSEDLAFIDADSFRKKMEHIAGKMESSQNETSYDKKKGDGKKRNRSKNAEGIEIADMGSHEEDIKYKNRDVFEDVLVKEPDSHTVKSSGGDVSSTFNAHTEGISKQHGPSNDSFTVSERDILAEEKVYLQNLGAGETLCPVHRRGNTNEGMQFTNRTQEMDNNSGETSSSCATDSVIIRGQKEEDWFKFHQPNVSPNRGFGADNSVFVGDYHSTSIGDHTLEKNKKNVAGDDSFIIQTHRAGTTSEYQPTADIIMVSDIVGADQPKHNTLEKVKSKVEATDVNEPDDLCMVLARDAAADQVDSPWNPEMDYINDLTESENNSVDMKLPRNDKDPNTKCKTPREKAVEKETSCRSLSGTLARSKSPYVSRTTPKSKYVKEEESRKKMEELVLQRQRRIAERSAGTVSSIAASNRTMKESKRSTEEAEKLYKPICRSSTIDRLATARITPKPSPKESQNISSMKMVTGEKKFKPTDKSYMNKSNVISVVSDGPVKENNIIKELQSMSSVEKIEKHVISSDDTCIDKNCDQMSNGRTTMPNEDQSFQPQDMKVSNDKQSAISASKDIISVDNAEISTPPLSDEVKRETPHSRKKWITGGDSPQVTKSIIRKLLVFGQKS